MERLESPSLGGAEVGRERERGEALESTADLLEPELEGETSRGERRRVLVIGPDDRERVAQ